MRVWLISGLGFFLFACAHTPDPSVPPPVELDKGIENSLSDCIALCQPNESRIAQSLLDFLRHSVGKEDAKQVLEPLAADAADILNASRAGTTHGELREIYEQLDQQLAYMRWFSEEMDKQAMMGRLSLRQRFPEESICAEEQAFRPDSDGSSRACKWAGQFRREIHAAYPGISLLCERIEGLLRAKKKVPREEGVRLYAKLQGYFDYPSLGSLGASRMPADCEREVKPLMSYRKKALWLIRPLQRELEALQNLP